MSHELNFFRKNVRFATVVNGKPAYLTDDYFVGTVHSFFNRVKGNGWLPVKKIQMPSISLRVYVYEQPVVHFSLSSWLWIDLCT
jgi:hypothetical protein